GGLRRHPPAQQHHRGENHEAWPILPRPAHAGAMGDRRGNLPFPLQLHFRRRADRGLRLRTLAAGDLGRLRR
ncbi:MAG: Putative preQ0 transporter YhhQ, partial [uncultured Thermomicrobiales bacterium]